MVTVRLARALPVPLTIAAVAVPSAPVRASDGDGGASAPIAGGSPPIARPGPEHHAGPQGGASPRNPRHRRLARRRSAPLLTSFALHRPRLFLYGRAARVSFH